MYSNWLTLIRMFLSTCRMGNHFPEEILSPDSLSRTWREAASINSQEDRISLKFRLANLKVFKTLSKLARPRKATLMALGRGGHASAIPVTNPRVPGQTSINFCFQLKRCAAKPISRNKTKKVSCFFLCIFSKRPDKGKQFFFKR